MLFYWGIGIITIIFGYLIDNVQKEKKIFAVALAIILICFSGLRGDFCSDYYNYVWIFQDVAEHGLWEVANSSYSQEVGFLVLAKIVSFFGNEYCFHFVICAITIICLFITFFDNSTQPGLSIGLFVGLGGYYALFNTSRAILAVAIASLGYKYLKGGNFIRYTIYVIIASLFHTSSLIMIPMYFVLRKKYDKYSFVVYGGVSFALLGILEVVNFLLPIISKIIPRYSDYINNVYMQNGALGNALIPLCSFVLILFLILIRGEKKVNNLEIRGNSVLLNGSFLFALLAIASTRIYLFIRFSYFFEIFAWIYIANIICSMKKHENKLILILLLDIFVLIVPIYLLHDSGYNPYYFFWQYSKY